MGVVVDPTNDNFIFVADTLHNALLRRVYLGRPSPITDTLAGKGRA
jgi:hypothetical protein